MSVLLNSDEVRSQSNSVWGQFKDLWVANANKNKSLKSFDIRALEHSGVGKFAVLVAMGSSLEENVETIKKYRNKIDVICCDKAFGPLYDHGIKADYVVVADAGIPYRFIENHIQHTEGVKLLSTPYANPEWTHNWKGPVGFYINQDAIETEQVFLKIMGNQLRVIPASSNVSNAMLVLWTNCEGKKNENWGGYENYFLVGYDYSWPKDGNYYAWDNPIPKRYYMNHRTMIDMRGDVCFTSENLLFSCKWLISYITTFDLPAYNCSLRGLLEIPLKADLKLILDKVNTKNIDIVRNAYRSWRQSYEANKQAERNFFTSKEVLLWQ